MAAIPATTDGSTDNAVPLLQDNNATYLQVQQPVVSQPVQMVVTQPQTIQPYTIEAGDQLLSDDDKFRKTFSDLTICHWLACLCCNCCGCAFIGFILNEVVNSARSSGNYKLAYFTHQKAKCWMIAACVCSALPWIIFIIMFAAGSLSFAYIGDQIGDLTGG